MTDMDKTIIGIDIGGTHFRIGAVDPNGTVSDFRKIPVGQVFTSADVLSDLSGYLRAYCEKHDAQAVSIEFPATLDAERTKVLQAPNIAFMEDLPVVSVLSKSLGIPVFIERDVTMALEYDCHDHRIPPRGIVSGFYFGTGIGNAISINGMPLIGKDGTAGELGHIPVDGSDVPCGCGNRGCMECLAGGKYLVQLCRTVYKDSPIEKLFSLHGQEAPLLEFVDRMAMAIATEINILDPHHILIGGGVPSMVDFPRAYLLEKIRLHTRKPLPADDLNIRFAEDRETKAVIGAAIYGRKKLASYI